MTLGANARAPDRPREGRWFALARTPLALAAGVVLLGAYVALTLQSGAVARDLLPCFAGLLGVALVVSGAYGLGRRQGDGSHSSDLHMTRSRLEALIDASPLGIVAGDLEGRTILWNPAAERIFGWEAEEVLGRPYPTVPEGEESHWRAMRDEVLGGRAVNGMEGRRVTKDGRPVDVSVSAAPVQDESGAVVGTVALIEDLSRSRAAARQVKALESQLRQAQKLEVVGRLAAGIAHDFNNLLTAIRGNAELILAADDSNPGLEQDLREISRSAERASSLTRQLLMFTHQGPVESRPTDVNRLVKGVETLLQRLIGETIELRVELSVDSGAVLTDPNQVEQVIMNLVVNARDALPDGGRITVRTGSAEVDAEEARSLPYEVRPGPFAVITVMDDGVGMQPDTEERIFDPFFTTKPAGVGTGLGLSTVYSIVKQARGHIRVESEPGSGTTFRVYLPRAELEQASVGPESRAPRLPNGGSETVLVVEDEEAVLSMAQRALERQGYKVLPALSGREALALALKYPGEIHVLFCDVVMPDLTGREVAERVREVRPEIEVLMTSGYGERQLEAGGAIEDGAFLAKPYTPRDLTLRIRELLGEPAAS